MENKIREMIKAMFIYKHICRGWSVKKRNTDLFEFSKPSRESTTSFQVVKLKEKTPESPKAEKPLDLPVLK